MRAALKLALELFEQFGRDSRLKYEHQAIYKTITAIKEALAQPEQEPVAWINIKRDMTYLHGPYNADDIPLYTTPPQRTWVGLTDEDLAVCGDEDDVMLARYWERVCKEKNT